MPDYCFADGPLAGQTITLDGPAPDAAVAVEVVDIDQDPRAAPQHHYLLETPATADALGVLRFATTAVVGLLPDEAALVDARRHYASQHSWDAPCRPARGRAGSHIAEHHVTPERRRVLVAHPYPDLYGADLMLLRSMRAFRSSGWEVLLTVPEDGPLLARLDEDDIRPVVVPVPVLRKSLLRPGPLVNLAAGSAQTLGRLRRLLRESRPDMVYVNTLTLPHWLAAARLEHVPAVCHVRELESQIHPVISAALTAPLRLAQTVVANSAATRTFLLKRHRALAGRSVVVYNGYSFPEVAEVRVREDEGRRRITIVGRLSPRKGQDLAVHALAELVLEGLDVELELVGSVFPGYEWFQEDLHRLAAERGVSDRLLMRGFQPDVWPYLRGADVVAVPSRLEPFGGVAVEALAAGRPVVVTDVGGLPEIVTHGSTGLVVPPDDKAALVGALRQLLRDPGGAATLARRGQSDVRERFPTTRYERELLDVLASALPSNV